MNGLTTLDTRTLLLTIVPAVLIILILVGFLLFQRKRINKLQEQAKPRYGFLGKSIYSFLALVTLVSVLTVGAFTSQSGSGTVEDVSATKSLEVEIVYEVLRPSESGRGYIVEFRVVPLINQKPWGESGTETFDFFWKFDGELDTSKVELARTFSSPGGFKLTLPRGEYIVTLDAFGDQVSGSAEETIMIPN